VDSFSDDTQALLERISRVLHEAGQDHPIRASRDPSPVVDSAVLLLLGRCPDTREPCLIFNKRSTGVRQPGDLCFPGGSSEGRLDAAISRLMRLPGSPLTRWPYWRDWRKNAREASTRLGALLSTGLRESFEEMGLNPFGVRFLGPLPPQRLLMFDRKIYPMAVWIKGQKRFSLNWEVEKILHVPLKDFLEKDRYRLLRIDYAAEVAEKIGRQSQDFIAYSVKNGPERDTLWGATFRIVITFLELVFGFKAPEMTTLPVIRRTLDRRYYSGYRAD
jgi:8-oxo-dGTP pyrophosphatase MutT (NUDIX family)